jgi:hypothetical protein
MKGLLKLAFLAGGVALVVKFLQQQRAEWEGLTEPEVREKLATKLGDRVPTEARGQISDAVVTKMRERGMLDESGDVAPA